MYYWLDLDQPVPLLPGHYNKFATKLSLKFSVSSSVLIVQENCAFILTSPKANLQVKAKKKPNHELLIHLGLATVRLLRVYKVRLIYQSIGLVNKYWKTDIDKLERVQKRATKLIPELSKKSYKDRLKALHIFQH